MNTKFRKLGVLLKGDWIWEDSSHNIEDMNIFHYFFTIYIIYKTFTQRNYF